jgi:hypothetical protein
MIHCLMAVSDWGYYAYCNSIGNKLDVPLVMNITQATSPVAHICTHEYRLSDLRCGSHLYSCNRMYANYMQLIDHINT